MSALMQEMQTDIGLVSTVVARSSLSFIDGEKGILEYVGYDTSESNINGMGFYKIRQVMTYINAILYNYRHSILFTICVLIMLSMCLSMCVR
mgnify:CR=1 FL=1